MKALYINIVLAVIALAAVGFGAYEYGISHAGLQQRPAGAATANPGPSLVTKATDGSWTVRCRSDAPDKCAGSVNVGNKAGQLVMVWMIGANQAGGAVMTIQTPTGVALEPGLDLVLDDNAAHHMGFGACGPATCRASLVLDSAALDELRKATKAQASFTLGGRKVSYTVPVTGTDKMLTDVLPADAGKTAAPATAPKVIK